METVSSQFDVDPGISAEVRSALDEIQALPIVRPPAGLLARSISETGEYTEEGLRFTPDDAELSLLYSGLALVSRDLHGRLTTQPRADAALFERVVGEVSRAEERLHGASAFPAYAGLPTADLPTDLAGTTSIERLADASIVHEWTLKPGKRLFTAFSEEFRDTLCGKRGLYEQLKEGKLGASELMSAAVLTIMATGFAIDALWLPLCAYLAVLLVRTGLHEFCGAGDGRGGGRRSSLK